MIGVPMRRGDVVTIAATGDYGKPRPAVIVQTDALPTEHASVVICQMTFECNDAPDFRVTIDPTENNGLRVRSQVMADKPVTVRRERIGRRVGHLDDKDISRLNIALAFVMGLADQWTVTVDWGVIRRVGSKYFHLTVFGSLLYSPM